MIAIDRIKHLWRNIYFALFGDLINRMKHAHFHFP
jgi:hypothetical protein